MLIYLSMIESQDDRHKFERIYERYRNLMCHVAYKILGNSQDAEDAVHQAFVSIIQNIHKFVQIDCPETRSFIVLMTERKAIDLIRIRHSEKILPLHEDLVGLEIPAPGDHGLADALAKLPARYREVLLLRFDSGYSTRELAKMLGLTESGVRKLIGRAKDALRHILEEDGYGED